MSCVFLNDSIYVSRTVKASIKIASQFPVNCKLTRSNGPWFHLVASCWNGDIKRHTLMTEFRNCHDEGRLCLRPMAGLVVSLYVYFCCRKQLPLFTSCCGWDFFNHKKTHGNNTAQGENIMATFAVLEIRDALCECQTFTI